MVQICEKHKPLQLISPVNTDHAMFIWKSKPVLSSLKYFQDTKLMKYFFEFNYYCIIKFVYVYQVTPSLTWIGIFLFIFAIIAFTLNGWLLYIVGSVMYNIERTTTFAILEK